MKQMAMTRLIGCLASALFSAAGFAADGWMASLARDADAVVVGEIQSGQQLGTSHTFVLLVRRSIKGELAAGSTVNVSATARMPANRKLGGQYGLWFLKRSNSTQWTNLHVQPGGLTGTLTLEDSGYVPLSKAVSPTATGTTSASATLSDQMAAEIFASLDGYTDGKELRQLSLALDALQGSTMLSTYYRALRTRADPQLRVIGLAGSLASDHDVSALAEIADNLDLVRRSYAGLPVKLSITSVRSADPVAIESLGKIASAPEPEMQRFAALALENIHSRDSLPILAQLLDSTDRLAREAAITGMSRFVENLPIQRNEDVLNGKNLIVQGPTTYRTPETDKYSLSKRNLAGADDAEYIQFWKSWWASTKNQVMPGGQMNR